MPSVPNDTLIALQQARKKAWESSKKAKNANSTLHSTLTCGKWQRESIVRTIGLHVSAVLTMIAGKLEQPALIESRTQNEIEFSRNDRVKQQNRQKESRAHTSDTSARNKTSRITRLIT